MIAFLLAPLGRYAVMALVVAAVIGGIYWKGYNNGKAVIQARWDAAVQEAIKRGVEARRDAERDVPPDGLPNDKFNRD